MNKLTKRQIAILSFIKNSSSPPTYSEIGTAVGLRAPSTIHYQLQILENKGFLRPRQKWMRHSHSLTLTEKALIRLKEKEVNRTPTVFDSLRELTIRLEERDMKNRTTEVFDSLRELLTTTPPSGFIPFEVSLGTLKKFCFAKTHIDAKRKVVTHMNLLTVRACSIPEILEASKN